MKNNKTVGKKAVELQEKTPDSRDPIEIQREIHKDYENHVLEAISRGKKEYAGDFFIVVLTKKERLLENVLRNYFFVRASCPTPEYDQTVYHYHRKEEKIEFLWVLPSKETCSLFLENINKIVPEEQWLLDFVVKDANGELLKLSKKLNHEQKDSLLVEGA